MMCRDDKNNRKWNSSEQQAQEEVDGNALSNSCATLVWPFLFGQKYKLTRNNSALFVLGDVFDAISAVLFYVGPSCSRRTKIMIHHMPSWKK